MKMMPAADKEDEADVKISEVYKGLARKNGSVETGHEVAETTSTTLSPDRVG